MATPPSAAVGLADGADLLQPAREFFASPEVPVSWKLAALGTMLVALWAPPLVQLARYLWARSVAHAVPVTASTPADAADVDRALAAATRLLLDVAVAGRRDGHVVNDAEWWSLDRATARLSASGIVDLACGHGPLMADSWEEAFFRRTVGAVAPMAWTRMGSRDVEVALGAPFDWHGDDTWRAPLASLVALLVTTAVPGTTLTDHHLDRGRARLMVRFPYDLPGAGAAASPVVTAPH